MGSSFPNGRLSIIPVVKKSIRWGVLREKCTIMIRINSNLLTSVVDGIT